MSKEHKKLEKMELLYISLTLEVGLIIFHHSVTIIFTSEQASIQDFP